MFPRAPSRTTAPRCTSASPRPSPTSACTRPSLSPVFLSLLHLCSICWSSAFLFRRLPGIPPLLTALRRYLTDLTFIDDGNPDTIEGRINWNKRELNYRVLSEIEIYQHVPFNFPPVEPIRTFLTELPSINEKVSA